MDEPIDVFLAFGGVDREGVEEVAAQLRQWGWRVFMDTDLPSDADKLAGLKTRLLAARAVAVLLPENWEDSTYLQDELAVCRELRDNNVSVQTYTACAVERVCDLPAYTERWNWQLWNPAEPEAVAQRIHSTLAKRLGLPASGEDAPTSLAHLVGRETELRVLAEWLEPGHGLRAIVIQGVGGVGKSYLVDCFSLAYRRRFRAYAVVRLQKGWSGSAADLATLVAVQVGLAAVGDDALRQLGAHLAAGRMLLHIENVDTSEGASAVGRLLTTLDAGVVAVTACIPAFHQTNTCRVLSLAPLDRTDASELLKRRYRSATDDERPSESVLLDALGGLPLALELAATLMRYMGSSPQSRVLHKLSKRGFDISNPAANAGHDGALAPLLRASVDALAAVARTQLDADPDKVKGALQTLAHAPPAGVGASLAAVLCGWPDEEELGDVLTLAASMSVALTVSRERSPGWRLHPLFAAVLPTDTSVDDVDARFEAWFTERVGKQESWVALAEETSMRATFLERCTDAAFGRLAHASLGYVYAGPQADWLARGQRFEDCDHADHCWAARYVTAAASSTLDSAESTLCYAAAAAASACTPRQRAMTALVKVDALQQLGRVFHAQRLAQATRSVAADDGVAAWSAGCVANIYQSRGELDAALRIREEDELPVYERLGDVRNLAFTKGKIADIYQSRGELDAALRIREEEVLPVCERLGDVRGVAVIKGKIADIYQLRGELDAALRIREEDELPVYERLGDVREVAITKGKITDIYQLRGELDAALLIREEEVLPVYKRLGDVRNALVCRANMAMILLGRHRPGDRSRALALLRNAHAAAVRMKIPEATQIQQVIHTHWGTP